jgi:hypothetical protein
MCRAVSWRLDRTTAGLLYISGVVLQSLRQTNRRDAARAGEEMLEQPGGEPGQRQVPRARELVWI